MLVYDIKEVSQYAEESDYKAYKPKEVGTFAKTKDEEFVNCNKAVIPTLRNPKVPLDLNKGYDPNAENFFKSDTEEILMWVQGSHEDGSLLDRSLSEIDVIAQRGALNKIGYTIHNYFKNPWKLEACKYAGKMYIRKIDAPQEIGNKDAQWGRKFEELWIENDPDIKATYRMLKGKIGNKIVLLSAEVDATDDKGKYVEAKTCYWGNNKIASTWLQSYLGKVDVLHIAYKDRYGIVEDKPEQLKMFKVPGSHKKLSKSDANAMIGFLGDVIDWMYGALPDENETWVVEYNGGSTGQICLKSTGEEFLPNWYKQFVDRSTGTGSTSAVTSSTGTGSISAATSSTGTGSTSVVTSSTGTGSTSAVTSSATE